MAASGEGTLNVDQVHREVNIYDLNAATLLTSSLQILDEILSAERWKKLANCLAEEDRAALNLTWHRLDGSK